MKITGDSYWKMCDYEKTLEFDNRRLALCRQYLSEKKITNENLLAAAYMNRGATYDNTGKYEESLRDYGKGIAIRERLQEEGRLYDENALAMSYMNRGNTLGDMGRNEESLRDYGKSIAIREKLQEEGRLYDIDYIATPLLNKGILLADGLHDTQGALKLFHHAIALLEAEEELSYSANDTLQRLRYQRHKLTAAQPSAPPQMEAQPPRPSAPADTAPPKKKGLFGKLFGKKK